MAQNKKGMVYLVGAGPGDPGLMTLKGKECISEADVVIYDYLVNQSLLEYAKTDAELIYVGKKGGCHTMSQQEINRLIVKKSRGGHAVVRLKGGDPFIFGRGGEEAQELVEAGLDFEVVPGVTSAISVPAYAGIPLTHRDYTSTAAFITGHEDPHKKESDISWDKIATGVGTLVFLMGAGNLDQIAKNLIAHGRAPDTPVAVIIRGTFPEQRTLVGKLHDIARLALENDVKPPAIIVVGDVVHLRDQLNWFETKPLFGKRIIVTRAREQASGFLKALYRLGAECLQFPTIKVVPPENWGALDKAVRGLESYQWLLFTSVNGVKYFFERLEALGKDVRDLKGLRIAAIGPKTAETLQPFGIKPDIMPDEYRAEAMVECFKEWGIKGEKVLLPRAARAREVLSEELNKMGAEIDIVPAYQTIKPDQDTGQVWDMIEKGAIDMVTFTSSSTVMNFLEMFSVDEQRFKKYMANVAVACIGPITAKTAQNNGLKINLIPPEYTIESLTKAIIKYFAKVS